MASNGLTEAWRGAMAAKPSDWTLRGVMCGPREVDPAVRGSGWVAWAVGPDRERVSGDGGSPEDALVALTAKLRDMEA